MQGPMKAQNPKQLIAGTVNVHLTNDPSQLVGNCPNCSSRLRVQIRSDGTIGGLVACTRCKEIYRVKPNETASMDNRPRGIGVSYSVTGEWDSSAIMEYLFDNVGAVSQVQGGFVCQPDEYHADFPTIKVDERGRTVCFSLFGNYQERDAGAIIDQVVLEFGGKFHVNMHPLKLERWEYRDDTKDVVLIERRLLRTLMSERIKKPARS